MEEGVRGESREITKGGGKNGEGKGMGMGGERWVIGERVWEGKWGRGEGGERVEGR